MCDTSNSIVIQTDESGLVRPDAGQSKSYVVDFGQFAMLFENGYLKVPEQALYADVDMDLLAGDEVELKLRIPTNYLNSNTGITLLNRDLNGLNSKTSLQEVFAADLDWMNNSDLDPGSDSMYGWDKLLDDMTVSVSSVYFYNDESRIGEILITYHGLVTKDCVTSKLRLSLKSGLSFKHKVNVLYGRLNGGDKNCFKFSPQYSITLNV